MASDLITRLREAKEGSRETYPVSVVTEYGQSENDLLACTVYYGQTNAHWYAGPDDAIWPELPSACVLILTTKEQADGH